MDTGKPRKTRYIGDTMGHKRHKGTQKDTGYKADTGDPRGHREHKGTQCTQGGHKENTGEHRVTQSKTG